MEDDDFETNSDSTRKLASVQLVESVSKHPNADTLQIVTITGMGWQVVTKVGDVNAANQKVVFCEVDSLLPAKADWLPPAIKAQVEKETKDIEFFRIKTIRLRGEISQGLILVALPFTFDDLPIGTDVTEKLGIAKYEPNRTNSVYIKGAPRINPFPFPTELISKTDEPSIQSHTKLLSAVKAIGAHVITVKHDGSSATFLIDPRTDIFLSCSRNQWRPKSSVNDIYWEIALKYNIEQKLREHYPHYALQGEICGQKIQRNLLDLKENTFFVFGVFDLKQRKQLGYDDIVDVCKKLSIPMVQFVQRGNTFDMTVKDLLILAEGFYPNTKNYREGIVVRTEDRSVSFKVINDQYRIKNGY